MNLSEFRPLGDQVLVERDEAAKTIDFGDWKLELPDTVEDKPNTGVVIAVGSGIEAEDGSRIPLDVAVGQHIMFSQHAGVEVILDHKPYLIVKNVDILATD